MLVDDAWSAAAGADAPAGSKIAAASAIVIWIAVSVLRPHAAVHRQRLLMPLWLSVCLVVSAAVLVIGLVAYLIDRSNHA